MFKMFRKHPRVPGAVLFVSADSIENKTTFLFLHATYNLLIHRENNRREESKYLGGENRQ